MAKKNIDVHGFGFDYGRQMKLNMRQKSSVCFCNHLKVAEKANYNEIHGKYSVINVKIQDYSQGKGEKSTWVEFNLDPVQIKTIKQWVSTIYPAQLAKDHKPFESVKVFNESYSKIELIHASKNRNPFAIKITKGTADNQKKLVKGSEKFAMQWFGAEEFYGMWDDIYDKLRDWERYHSSLLFRQYELLTEKAVSEDYANKQNQQTVPPQPKNVQQPQYQPQRQQQQRGVQQNARPTQNQVPSYNRPQQQNNTRANNTAPMNGNNARNNYPAPPPPPAPDMFSSTFEETANYGSAYRR